MLCINNTITDVYFNISSEDHLFSNFKEDVFMIWQNEPSVVVGKHQDIHREVNLLYSKEENINIARRFSGGGAVFHDLGNINFSFISGNRTIDFRQYAEQIVDALSLLGLEASVDARNAIWLNGRKISGSAQYMRKSRHLFHGTLLFSSDLERLNRVLQSDDTTTESDIKFAIPSVKSPVTNIKKHLKNFINITDFKNHFFNYILHQDRENQAYHFNTDDIERIEYLTNDLYRTRDWTINAKKKDISTKKQMQSI